MRQELKHVLMEHGFVGIPPFPWRWMVLFQESRQSTLTRTCHHAQPKLHALKYLSLVERHLPGPNNVRHRLHHLHIHVTNLLPEPIKSLAMPIQEA